MKKWIAIDLDRTLAQYESGDYKTKGPTYIGPPIMPMVNRVKKMLAQGLDVRIFTARALDSESYDLLDWDSKEDHRQVIRAIQGWCEEHIGKVLPITCVKDQGMEELWDDKAIQVIPNTGVAFPSVVLAEVVHERMKQDAKWGQQNHEPAFYYAILAEEVGEAAKEVVEYNMDRSLKRRLERAKKLREELIQTIAVGVAMVESLDRNELS